MNAGLRYTIGAIAIAAASVNAAAAHCATAVQRSFDAADQPRRSDHGGLTRHEGHATSGEAAPAADPHGTVAPALPRDPSDPAKSDEHMMYDPPSSNHGAAVVAPQEHAGHARAASKPVSPGAAGHQDYGTGAAMTMGRAQGGPPPADARDPDYSQGLKPSHTGGMEMADDEPYGRVLFQKLESSSSSDETVMRLDGQASYGGDSDRLVVEVDGEAASGSLDATRIEALWSRAVATFWTRQLGLRQDAGGNGRKSTWVAIGIAGLAPYWFELEATAYIGTGGRWAARAEIEYELLFTQRLVLTPLLEVNAYGQSDAARGTGAGLSDVELGVRLRYEFTRQFAPYIGVALHRRYGRAAGLANAAGESDSDTQWVAGARIWF